MREPVDKPMAVTWDAEAAQAAADRLDQLTKPRGSLGALETIVKRLAGMTGTVVPRLAHPAVLLFAADHGVARRGVSPYPPSVTAEMTANIAMGGAVSSVLARSLGLPLRVVDVGVAAPRQHPAVIDRKVRWGTADMTEAPAMTVAEAEAAVEAGREEARVLVAQGVDALLLGEMGIGNTTATAALAAALLGLPPDQTVGPGTGLDEAGIGLKRAVVRQALDRHRAALADPWTMMAAVGGLEIAALAGAMLEAAAMGLPVVLDGVTVGVAALWAVRLNPRLPQYLIAGHVSPEPAHRAILHALDLSPLLDLGLRLGEGSGALLAWPLIQAALAVMRETATFRDAQVSDTPTAQEPSPTHLSRPPVPNDFTPEERAAVYKVIRARRDIRSYLDHPVPDAVLRRILEAGHQAPSVGFMQPWNFIVIRDPDLRAALHALAERERQAQADDYEGLRRSQFLHLKVEGFVDAPVTLCVTMDPARGGVVLGRRTIRETDLLSTACAIENVWLAARAEGLGVGWVSFYQKADVRALLGIPEGIEPVALLTLGYTADFPDQPLLERTGWAKRRPLDATVYDNRWGVPWHDAP